MKLTERFPRLARLQEWSRRHKVVRILGITALVFFVLFTILAIYVYRVSVKQFEVRRLSLPTRVYADYTPLRTGLVLQKDDLLEKLDRLGYHETADVAQPGEYAVRGNGVDIHTRAFKHPTGDYPAQVVRVVIAKSQIESVGAQNPDRAALEPELLTSILSEELENRRPVTLDQVPKHVQDAVVVTEDVRFWHHPGVDPFGIGRAIFTNIRKGGVSEGASTLTQQLVKNYYLTSERTFRRKIVEVFMAVILDARYSKREILEAYLNDIYLGRNRSISLRGVGEASRFYFGKPISEINVAEGALLAGMIKSPNNISPFAHPEEAIRQRNLTLSLMLKHEKIDQKAYEEARSAKLPKKPFREKTGLTSIPYYVDRVLQEMARDYGYESVKGLGLQIYTAIDLGAQDAAALTLENGLRSLEKSRSRLRRGKSPLQGALIHVDVPSGEIRALVGGRNYEQSQFNRALHSKRLVGSLFKPFVYLTAFEPSLSNQNITPETLVSDTRFVLKRRWASDWSPRNYDEVYHGNVTVRQALEQSLNCASVRIGLACGVDAILKSAKVLGVETELDDNPSVILGAVGIPPIEMADAYSTIARQGSRMPLHTIRFVTNDRGRVVAAGGEVKAEQVFPQRDVYLLTYVMRGVVDRGTGASSRAIGFRKIAAGKTGTTNDKRDAWFIGFTPQTLALTWVGFDDNSPTGLSGSDAAVPMWARYMIAVTAGQQNADFASPTGITFTQVDKTSGGLATPYCPPNVVINEAFKSGTEPSQMCPLHTGQIPAVPMFDEFGNPITATDTTGTMPPPPEPVPTETTPTLTGGIFKTDTTSTEPPPPPPPDPLPAPATDTTTTSTQPP